MSINPDEAVVYGAALEAAKLTGVNNDMVLDALLLDIAPMSFSLRNADGKMTLLVPRGTTIPTKASHIFTTSTDNQVMIDMYEGEKGMCQEITSWACLH